MFNQVVNLNKSHFDVFIGRPSKWGSPYKIGPDGSREEVIEKYKKWILGQEHLLNDLFELKDKILGCYCYPLPCHGDVLAELVNNKFSDPFQNFK